MVILELVLLEVFSSSWSMVKVRLFKQECPVSLNDYDFPVKEAQMDGLKTWETFLSTC